MLYNKVYTIHVCGPWRPSDLNEKSSVVLGYVQTDDGVMFRFCDTYWGNVFYKNGIILAVMNYETNIFLKKNKTNRL